MAQEGQEPAGTTRALLTNRERELIAKRDPEASDNRRYQAVSTVRNKVEDRLPEDVELLREHHPRLLGEIREVVCEKADNDG